MNPSPLMTLTAQGRHLKDTSPDCVDGVRYQTSADCYNVTKSKGSKETSSFSEYNRLQRVVEAEVASSVHDDSHTGDDEASVQPGDAVRLEGLLVHVHQAVELALTTLLA